MTMCERSSSNESFHATSDIPPSFPESQLSNARTREEGDLFTNLDFNWL